MRKTTSAVWPSVRDGSLLTSAGDDRTVRVWDVRKRKQLWCLVGHTDWVSAVTFLGDNASLASAGADRTILVWDVTNGKAKRRLAGHTDIVRSLAFQRRNRVLLSAAEDGTVRSWDPETGSPSPLFPNGQLENPGGYWIRSLCLEPGEKTLLGVPFADQPVIVWDLRPGHAGENRQLKVAGNARSASIQGAANEPLVAFGLEDSYVAREAVWIARRCARAAGTRANGRRRGTVSRWECARIGLARRQRASVAPSPGRPRGAEAPPSLAGLHGPLDSSGKRVAVATMDGETQLLNFKTLNVIRRDRAAGGLPGGIAFSPDSATLAVLSRHEPLRLYSSAERPLEIPVPDRSSNDRISFSPNGRLIAIGDPLALSRGRRHPQDRRRPPAAQDSAPEHRVPRRLDRVDIQPWGRPVPLVAAGRASRPASRCTRVSFARLRFLPIIGTGRCEGFIR